MADKLVESKIRCDKVTLFTERGCRYCRNAEEMLKQYNFVPGALEVVDITQRKDVQDYLQQRTGHRTVSSRSCSTALADPLSQGGHTLASCCRGGGEGSFPTAFPAGSRGETAARCTGKEVPCFARPVRPVAVATAGRVLGAEVSARSSPQQPEVRSFACPSSHMQGRSHPSVVPAPLRNEHNFALTPQSTPVRATSSDAQG
ncbi:uncharacterized protein LOC133282801, partial [Pezoporus flaviventris]|uniref:uncharacterized protein LOC133282801 n=1 Tax=Pezoporus flaviventris TaxID=889875 RepID=UPI002AB31708